MDDEFRELDLEDLRSDFDEVRAIGRPSIDSTTLAIDEPPIESHIDIDWDTYDEESDEVKM